MKTKNEYKQLIKEHKEVLSSLKSELKLFNALIESKPNILQLENGRKLEQRVKNRYHKMISFRESRIDTFQSIINDEYEPVSINFSLK